MTRWNPSDLPRGGGQVRLEVGPRLAELVLDHPEHRNAVTPGMMADLDGAVTTLERWQGAGVLIRGEGERAFCSGGDLKVVQSHLVLQGELMCAFMQDVLGRLAALPVAVVAAVEGPALGGGAELLTCADVVFAGRSARVGFVHASLGVSPGWGGGARLVGRVGAARAVRLLASAARLSAEEARDMGLVHEVVPDGEAVAAARRWLDEVARNAPVAVRGCISVARAAAPSQASLDHEREVFTSLWGKGAHTAALAAVAVHSRQRDDDR